jgi:dynein heavy chain
MHRGNIILCGLGGSGRESLAKMAVFICSHLHASITSGVNYTLKEWRTDLKDYLLACGLEQISTTLILT